MAESERMNDKEIRKYLAAFADGELDVEQNLCVLEQMAMNPQATRRVMHQQQLRQMVNRALREMTPAVDPALRQRIAELALETETVRDAESSNDVIGAADGIEKPRSNTAAPSVLARLTPWLPAIAAAILLAASAAIWFVAPPRGGTSTPPAVAIVRAPDLLDAKRINVLETRHQSCSERIELLHNAERFGRAIADVPSKVTGFLGEQTSPILDLSALGYEFSGAGECAAPGARAVHLVYRHRDAPVSSEAISLWVRADPEESINVQAGKLYEVPRPQSAGSIVMWRTGGSVYYLVGDAAEEVKNAALALQ